MVQVLIINDGPREWHLPPALSQSQRYCDDKADTPTSGFPLHSFISVLYSKSILVHFSLVDSICSCYSTPFNIKHKNKQAISLSYPAEKSSYSSLTCDVESFPDTLKIGLTFYHFSSKDCLWTCPRKDIWVKRKSPFFHLYWHQQTKSSPININEVNTGAVRSPEIWLFIYGNQHV